MYRLEKSDVTGAITHFFKNLLTITFIGQH